MNEKTRKIVKWTVTYAIVSLIAFLAYYITLPAINLQSEGFWFFLAFLIFLYTLPLSGVRVNMEVLTQGEFKFIRPKRRGKAKLMALTLVPILVVVLEHPKVLNLKD